MKTYQFVGRPVPRPESGDKVTGRAYYTADVSVPGVVWGKSLHSPYPHAHILSIDTHEARELPGVFAVITGEDVNIGMYGRAIKDIPVLADGVVRFAGERVAAVAAVDEDTALQALNLIEVEYAQLPAVFEIEEALEEDAPLLHPAFDTYTGGSATGVGSNGYDHTSTDRGDLEAGFADADLIVENTFTTPRVHQGYLEPQSVLVSTQGDTVNVWTSSKAPYATRQAMAHAIGLPEDRIVFHHVFIGGDFGGKATPAELPVAYFLSRACGRPVRMVLDYLEEFMSGNPRHSTLVKLRTGVKEDGRLTAHQVHFYVNCGAYAGYKPGRTIGGAAQAAGPYRIPNTRIESTHVYTNLVPGGHMRAPGYPQAVFALESHIDDIARRLGMDPLAFRLKNLITEGAAGLKLRDVRVVETLQAAAQSAGYDAPKPAYVGRGLAVGDHPPGGGQGHGSLSIRANGKIVLGTPIFDQGTGTYTTLRQIIAEELGAPIETIELEVWSTESTINDSGIGGSRGTRVATAVAHEVAQNARAALLDLAASRLNWPRESLTLSNGEVRRTDTDEAQDWRELAGQQDLIVHARIEERGAPPLTSFCAQVAEVEIDPETGQIKLRRFTTAHDVGRILNPIGHQGQINGGFVQGLGFALMEELRIEEGRVTTLSFGDYKLPTIRDIPELQTVLLESESGVGPYQVRGIGENAIVPVAPAIANAIADAVGVRIRSLPLTAEKVYRALKSQAVDG